MVEKSATKMLLLLFLRTNPTSNLSQIPQRNKQQVQEELSLRLAGQIESMACGASLDELPWQALLPKYDSKRPDIDDEVLAQYKQVPCAYMTFELCSLNGTIRCTSTSASMWACCTTPHSCLPVLLVTGLECFTELQGQGFLQTLLKHMHNLATMFYKLQRNHTHQYRFTCLL